MCILKIKKLECCYLIDSLVETNVLIKTLINILLNI